ncbi:MAG: sugar-binding protein [Ardenticatenaceae bacterium]|nr:sugar-binding protein [Ardenticatenaceae bacterium]
MYKVMMTLILTALIFVGASRDIAAASSAGEIPETDESLITGYEPASLETDVTIYVATSGSDSNDGSAAAPLATIIKAVDQAVENQANGLSTKVLIREGTYNEADTIRLYGDGTLYEDLIILEGEGEVVVSGAREWTDWQIDEEGVYFKEWPYRWGRTIFSYEGRIPEVMNKRELVLVDGEPILPVLFYEDLEPGTFYVSEPEGKIFIMKAEEIADLNEATVEVSESGGFLNDTGEYALGGLFHAKGMSNLVIKNLDFEKAAAGIWNAVLFTEVTNLLIEDSRFSQNVYTGLLLEKCTNVSIYRSEANDNGGKGMAIKAGKNIIISGSATNGNNWFGYPNGWIGWDPAGLKLFLAHDILIEKHQSIGNLAEGLWPDTDMINVIMRKVVVIDNAGYGIFIEANVGPVLVEKSIIVGNGKPGIYNSSTQYLTVDKSLISDNKDGQIAIFDAYGAGRGPLVGDNDYANQFHNFETGEPWISHATDMVITRSLIQGRKGSTAPLLAIHKADKVGYQNWLDTLSSDRNRYAHETPESAFVILDGDAESYVNLQEWQDHTGVDTRSRWRRRPYWLIPDPDEGDTGDTSFAEPLPGQKAMQASYVQGNAPTIDGDRDAVWDSTTSVAVDVPVQGDPGIDATGVASLLWDDAHLYYFVDVTDDQLSANNPAEWQHDNVEFFLDQNNRLAGPYEADDSQYRVNFENFVSGNNISNLMESATMIHATGYNVEGKIELDRITPALGAALGIDFQIGDEEEVNGAFERVGVMVWSDETGNGWQDTSNFGYLRLVEVAEIMDVILAMEEITTNLDPSLKVGTTHQIEFEVKMSDGTLLTPAEIAEGQVIYGSSHPEVIAVDENGFISALSVGESTLSIRFKRDGETKSYETTVVVPRVKDAYNFEDVSPRKFVVDRYEGDVVLQTWGIENVASGTELVFYEVDFGDDPYDYLIYNLQGNAPQIGDKDFSGGTIELRLDDPSSEPFGTLTIEKTFADAHVDPWHYDNSILLETYMDTVTGKHDLYMRFVGAPFNSSHLETMGKFYWANFKKGTGVKPGVTVEMVELFNLDFAANDVVAGDTPIVVDGTQVAALSIVHGGGANTFVNEDGVLKFTKVEGNPWTNPLTMSFHDFAIPDTGRIQVDYTMNAKRWSQTGGDSYADFPKFEFTTPAGTVDYGILVMQKMDALMMDELQGYPYIVYTSELNDTDLAIRFDIDLAADTFEVFVNGQQRGGVFPLGGKSPLDGVSLTNITFSMGNSGAPTAADPSEVWFDDFAVSYEVEVADGSGEIVDLFELNFDDNTAVTGMSDIEVEGAVVATLEIENAGSSNTFINEDGVLKFTHVTTDPQTLVVNNLDVPETGRVIVDYTMNIQAWSQSGAESYADFPKLEFEFADGTVDYGILVMQKLDALMMAELQGYPYIVTVNAGTMNTSLAMRFDVDLETDTFEVYVNDAQVGGTYLVGGWSEQKDAVSLKRITFNFGNSTAPTAADATVVWFDDLAVRYELTE